MKIRHRILVLIIALAGAFVLYNNKHIEDKPITKKVKALEIRQTAVNTYEAVENEKIDYEALEARLNTVPGQFRVKHLKTVTDEDSLTAKILYSLLKANHDDEEVVVYHKDVKEFKVGSSNISLNEDVSERLAEKLTRVYFKEALEKLNKDLPNHKEG